MDDTDLYKVNTQPGYMTINHIPLAGIKNTESYNEALAAAFENSCYMDSDQSVKRIAMMVNATEKVQKAVDNSMECIIRYFGTPIEKFQHIQPDIDEDLVGDDYVDVICCGMNYPERPIRDISSKYDELKKKLNPDRKSFDDIFGDIDMDDLDDFNIDIKQMANPAKADALFQAEETIADIAKSARKNREVEVAQASSLPIRNKRDVAFSIDGRSAVTVNAVEDMSEF